MESAIMEISSVGRARCFDFALDFLGWFDGTVSYQFSSTISSLQMSVKLLQSFDLYLSKRRRRRRRSHEVCWEQDEVEKDAISFRIQDLIIKRVQDLEIFSSKYFSHSRSPGVAEIKSELTRFGKAIKLFFKTDLKESCINFLLDYYWLRDPEIVIEFIDSVSKTLVELLRAIPVSSQQLIAPVKTLKEKLVFLKSFIRFAILHGVEGIQLIDLLIHAEVVAINALCLISMWSSDRCDEEVPNEMGLQISQLICEKIDPSDPQVRDTYIHVLTTSKLSRSSDILALEKNKHLVADFIDCLVHSIMEQSEICTRIPVPTRNQMQKLHKGLTFLTIILRRHQKFDELCHEMKNLIGLVVCDAAIVIFSHSLNQLLKEGLARETDHALFHLLKALEFIRAEVAQAYPLTSVSGSKDFLQKNLEELIQTVQKDLGFLRSFLEIIEKQRNQNEKLQTFLSCVTDVAYKADLVINSTIVAGDINLIKIKAQEIYNSISHDGETKRATEIFSRMPSQVTAATHNEDLVGLVHEVETITYRLVEGSSQLDVIPIVGMAGIGKTALAYTVYSSSLVTRHFHICAWLNISQVYGLHSFLIHLLCSFHSMAPVESLFRMCEYDLAKLLYNRLTGNRYLIILDDLRDIEAWKLLERSFPNDANGSRILITSRLQNLSLADSVAYHLRHLTDEESWKLLQSKLAGKEGYLAELSEVGFQIAKSCRGLPLAVVLVAGILATSAEDCLENVAKSLTSSFVLDDENCMETLNLSYNHLPENLRSCLLYLSAFQEDENIPVRRLLWLWISEGFVRKTEEKSLEDVANDYLKALVDRSLVMVSKQRTTGGAKACRIHDLVYEFCVKKAKEENFLHIIRGKDTSSLTGLSNPHRVCDQNASNSKISEMMQFSPNLRSLLLFKKSGLMPKEENLGSQVLRVLDLGNLVFDAYFPREVVELVHLRYLALHIGGIESIPSAIANLSRLETFLVRGNSRNTLLPETIWNIKTLRHLCTTSSGYGFTFPVENVEASPGLDHLDTLTLAIDPTSQNLQKILKKLPSIRRLKCFSDQVTRNCDMNLAFDYMSQLESLSLHRFDGCGFKFPLNLKKLTLFSNRQPWSEISTVGKLPSLEVLKLLSNSFVGKEWEVKAGEFPYLRVLKLSSLNFHSWTASSDNFSRIEKLAVEHCSELEELPSCLGECPNLEMVEVSRCRKSLASSVKQIQEEQMDSGNEMLKIVIEDCAD